VREGDRRALQTCGMEVLDVPAPILREVREGPGGLPVQEARLPAVPDRAAWRLRLASQASSTEPSHVVVWDRLSVTLIVYVQTHPVCWPVGVSGIVPEPFDFS